MQRSAFLLFFLLAGCTVGWGPADGSTSSPPPPPAPPPTATDDTPKSSDYGLGDLFASMSASDDGKTLTVYAALLVSWNPGGDLPPFVHTHLEGGDTLVARAGDGPEVTLTLEPDEGETAVGTDVRRYYATFPSSAADVDLVVSLRRAAGRDGAPLSEVRIAAPFTIASAPDRFRAGADLVIGVAPAPADWVASEVELDGDCISTGAGRTATLPATPSDDGKLHVDTTGLVVANGCDVRMHVRYRTAGTVDSVFHRGAFGAIWTFDAVQQREVGVHLDR